MSIDELISLSTDANTTRNAFSFGAVRLSLGSGVGGDPVRKAIAGLFPTGKHEISHEHVITATGATGANSTVFHSLVQAGDHVICSYPIYGQLLQFPKALGCEISLWRLDQNNGWALDIEELRKLFKPSTKLLILNNPNNPTGSFLNYEQQVQILDIAREHGVVVFVDEIFRPLFHKYEGDDIPPSFVQHDYSKVVVTGSMSKAWGLSGLRVGWMVSRDQALRDLFINTRMYILEATSNLDEIVAAEALSERCRPFIIQQHLNYAKENLSLLDKFIAKNSDVCRWTKPTAGATAFIQFLSSATGEPEDDVDFCKSLLSSKGVLLSPGSLCFSEKDGADFKGFTRVHLTGPPSATSKTLDLIDAFLQQRR